jgi:hypothetical protein
VVSPAASLKFHVVVAAAAPSLVGKEALIGLSGIGRLRHDPNARKIPHLADHNELRVNNIPWHKPSPLAVVGPEPSLVLVYSGTHSYCSYPERLRGGWTMAKRYQHRIGVRAEICPDLIRDVCTHVRTSAFFFRTSTFLPFRVVAFGLTILCTILCNNHGRI